MHALIIMNVLQILQKPHLALVARPWAEALDSSA